MKTEREIGRNFEIPAWLSQIIVAVFGIIFLLGSILLVSFLIWLIAVLWRTI